MRFFKAAAKSKLALPFTLVTGLVSYKIYNNTSTEAQKVKVFRQADLSKYKQESSLYNLKSRQQHLQEVQSKEYDIVVVGGGCNGSGVLLEGANRG